MIDPFSYMGLFMCRGEGRGKRFSVGSDEKIDFQKISEMLVATEL